MRRVICWILGHDRLATRASHGVCLRCGLRVRPREYGRAGGWKELGGPPPAPVEPVIGSGR